MPATVSVLQVDQGNEVAFWTRGIGTQRAVSSYKGVDLYKRCKNPKAYEPNKMLHITWSKTQ